MENIRYCKSHTIPSSYSSQDNDIYDMLSQDSFLMLNRKIISTLGLELATFITFLVDKQKYYRDNDRLDLEGYFYITNSDLILYTGIKSSRINRLKNEAVERKLLLTKKAGIPLKTYYKVNLNKIRDIISNSKSSLELSYERLINDENIDSSDLSSFSISSLDNKTYRDLRLICKKLKISYTGKDKKEILIKKILNRDTKDIDLELLEKSKQKLNPITSFEEIDFSNFNQLNSFNFVSLRLICKKLKISYTGKDKKEDLIKKVIKEASEEVSEQSSGQSSGQKVSDNLINNEFLEIKNLILNFTELNLTWNSSIEKIIYNFYKKHGYKLTSEFLSSNYKNLVENKQNVKNLSGCFISLIKKEQRQLNSTNTKKKRKINNGKVSEQSSGQKASEEVSGQSSGQKISEEVSEQSSGQFNDNFIGSLFTQQKDISNFYKLDEYEKLKIEEKAIDKYILEHKNINIDSIINIKKSNEKVYYQTLEKYIVYYL